MNFTNKLQNKNKFLFTIAILFCNWEKIRAYRVFNDHDVHTILAVDGEKISIVCKTGVPMAYCGFIDPKGKRYSFSGQSLADGHCAININATKDASGRWKCHIGKREIGIEFTQSIDVRVSGEVAAVQSNVTAIHRKDITLLCVTTKDKIPLRYCRFEPPTGTPFSIDSAVKNSSPILGKYFYPEDMSLDRGDCAVTIKSVKYSDAGFWTCGAGLDDGKEHTAAIKLELEGLFKMSAASTTGAIYGAVGIIIFLAILGFIAWKKRQFLGTRARQPEIIDIRELGPVPTSPGSQRSQRSRSHTPTRSVPQVTVQSPSEQSISAMLM